VVIDQSTTETPICEIVKRLLAQPVVTYIYRWSREGKKLAVLSSISESRFLIIDLEYRDPILSEIQPVQDRVLESS
jgi:hypothetical protein